MSAVGTAVTGLIGAALTGLVGSGLWERWAAARETREDEPVRAGLAVAEAYRATELVQPTALPVREAFRAPEAAHARGALPIESHRAA